VDGIFDSSIDLKSPQDEKVDISIFFDSISIPFRGHNNLLDCKV